MASKRKTVTMMVITSVPRWMTAAQARREIRSMVNHGAGWLSHGPDFEEIEVRARKVSPTPRLTAGDVELCVRGLQKLRASTIYEDERATLQALADKMARAHV